MEKSMTLIGGRYAAVNTLGRGGFGAVYLVTDTQTQQPAAVKFLSAVSPDALERFRREVRVLTSLRENPYVVRILDHALDHTPPYLVMEFCEGGSLRSWVETRRSWREVAAALVHVLLGLRAIHQAGGFHRDLKPENLLVARNARVFEGLIVKVADWGLARLPESQSPITRNAAGTEGYIAPEVLAGGPFDARADIFSLGVIASELLTGDRTGKGLGSVRMPEPLRLLARQMLDADPGGRPTAFAIGQTLQGLLAMTNVIEVAEPVNDNSGVGGLLLGGLLIGGALMALAAFADEGGDAGAPKPAGPASMPF